MLRTKIYRAAAVSLSLMLLIFACVPAMADTSLETDGRYAVIKDEADLLTDEEEEALLRTMEPLLAYGGAAFVSTDYNPGSPADYAEDMYRSYFGYAPAVLLLVDMDNRYLQFYADGSSYDLFTEGRTNEIADNIYTYASEGDYYSCAREGFSQCLTLLEGGRIATPMKHVTNAILAVGIALMINIWIVYAQRKKLDPSLSVDTFDTAHGSAVQHVYPRMMSQKRTRHTESSGGGGGGRGGGGGHSGGGGGHSF